MTNVVFLNEKQTEMLERLKDATKRFDDQKLLRANPTAIESAKALIGEAHALDMPPVSYTGLQIYVSMYETEMDLPEHLRNLSHLTG